MATSASSKGARQASSSSRALSIFSTRTPKGSGSITGPEISVTSAPRSRAASARAKPIFPEESFEM